MFLNQNKNINSISEDLVLYTHHWLILQERSLNLWLSSKPNSEECKISEALNAMRNLFAKNIETAFLLGIAFCSFSNNSFAQNLNKGKFSYSGGFEGSAIIVKSHNRFEYNSWSCTGGNRGSGHYTIKDSTLCLVFENEHKIDSMLTIIYESTNTDSTEILISFKDQEDKKFIDEGVAIYVKKNNKTIGGTYSSSQVSTIKIPNNSLPISLDIKSVGYNNRQIKIDSNGKYEILCSLQTNFMHNYGLGDSLFFVLNKYNRKQIQMRSINDEKGYFIVYFRNKSWLHKIFFRKKSDHLVSIVKKN